MNSTKFVYSVIAVLVAVIFIGSCLAPTVENAINGKREVIVEETLTNVGTPVTGGDLTSEYKISWNPNDLYKIVVNGEEFTVSFNANGGDSPSFADKTVINGMYYGELPTITRTGYTFAGWFTTNTGGTEITENTEVALTVDQTLYAHWTANQYTVTFDADGGTVSPASKTVTYGQEYGELPTPTYSEHTFGGWFDSNNNPITSITEVSIAENHTLTAVWTLGPYLVSFSAGAGGTVSPSQSFEVANGTAYTISSNTITIGETTITATADSGYHFVAWTPATSGTVSASMTFTASFEPNSVTATFTTDGNGTVSSNSLTVPYGTTYSFNDNTITFNTSPATTITATANSGYAFDSWTPNTSGSVTSAVTFTASFVLDTPIYQLLGTPINSGGILYYTQISDGRNTFTGATATSSNTTYQVCFRDREGILALALLKNNMYDTRYDAANSKWTSYDYSFDYYLNISHIPYFQNGYWSGWDTDSNIYNDIINGSSVQWASVQQTQSLSPSVINLTPLNPISPAIQPLNPIVPMQLPATLTDDTSISFLAGGQDWLITPIEVDTDTYNLALYYVGLTEPMLWDEQVTITFSNGTCSFTNNGQEYTFTYDTIYYKADSGNYVYRDVNGTYGKEESVAIGWLRPTATSMLETDGECVTLVEGDIESTSDYVITSGETQYDGVFQLISITTDVTVGGETSTVSFDKIIVPSAITIEITEEVPAIDPTLAALLVFVVTISIIAVVLAAVRMIGGKE